VVIVETAHREPRWPPLAAVLVLMGASLVAAIALPEHTSWLPPGLVTALEGLLLLALLAQNPMSERGNSRSARVIATALVGLVVAAALWGTVQLTKDLVDGSPATNSAGSLLAYGGIVLVSNMIAFALGYWLFDSGGPLRRIDEPTRHPDIAFPQQLNPDVAPPGWRPVFWDYLYLGFTNSLAFSPTDAMPLAHWPKLAMTVQAAISLTILGLVVARAVNVFT